MTQEAAREGRKKWLTAEAAWAEQLACVGWTAQSIACLTIASQNHTYEATHVG